MDIVACQRKRCLYALDDSCACIWRIDVDDNYKTTLFAKVKGHPRALSVTSKGALLVINRRYNIVDVFDEGGCHTHSIKMPVEMNYIRNAV